MRVILQLKVKRGKKRASAGLGADPKDKERNGVHGAPAVCQGYVGALPKSSHHDSERELTVSFADEETGSERPRACPMTHSSFGAPARLKPSAVCLRSPALVPARA